MSTQVLCRLCLCFFEDNYKKLFNDGGACNEAYDIASKYFDPMLLINGQEHGLAVLCSICWQHIHDFYYFQQEVYQAHLKFDKLKEACSGVKVEHESFDSLYVFDGNCNKQPRTGNLTPAKRKFYFESDLFSSEDQKPLMEQFVIKNDNAKRKLKKEERIQQNEANTSTKNKSKMIHSISKSVDEEYTSSNKRNKVDTQMKTLENDTFIASWRSELDCLKCSETFTNFTLLRKHFLKYHADEKCYIVCCDRKFRSRYHIVEHIKLHVNPNAYRCEICGKCSTNSRNLAKHKSELHSEEGKQRSLKCSNCLKILANKNSLKVHMETHETNLIYSCEECGKNFPSKEKRILHERHVHNANFICDQCGKKLHNQYAMKQHQLKHEGFEKRKWGCNLCRAELYSHSSLKRHKHLIHQEHTTVYECSVCGKVVTTEIALRTHKRNVHFSVHKHKCSFCEKAFKSPRVLREHISTHTGEDLYRCPHCERTFKMSANMHHHRKKVHPKEWTEGRLNRPKAAKINFESVSQKVVI